MRLVIIANPKAGRGRAFGRLLRHVREWRPAGWNIELLTTGQPGHAGKIARGLLSDPPDILAVCGGDGTVQEVVSSTPAPPFPVGIIPAGTANVLARELGLPLDPVRALNIVLSGAVRRVDCGRLENASTHGFLLMAGVGFDAYVASRVNAVMKDKIGIAAYYLATLRAMASYEFPEFRVVTDAESLVGTSCIIANAQEYGGGLVLTPGADMTDGLFDILVISGKPTWGLIPFLWSAWRRQPRRYPWMQYRRSRQVRVEGPEGILVQVDGEVVGGLPLAIDLLPSVFPLVVPGPKSQ
jgi:diacylglycerol kinase (ATP)